MSTDNPQMPACRYREQWDAVKGGSNDEIRNFGTGSRRSSREGKGRFDLIPPQIIERLAKHYENGAKRYGDHNWLKGQPISSYFDSLQRHINQLERGDQSEDHAIAAIWNLAAIAMTMHLINRGILSADLDDRPVEYMDMEAPTTIKFDEPIELAVRPGSFKFTDQQTMPMFDGIRSAGDEQTYEDAVREFYKIYNIDISRPMRTGEKILLRNYLVDRGFLNDPG